MIVLVPEPVLEELQERARDFAPDISLHPYTEEGAPPAVLDKAVAILRWIAGKRYSSLIDQGPNIRWLHTASAGVDHVLTPAVRAKAGLTVTDSGPAFEIAISEFVLAWMLMVAHRMPELLKRQERRHWEWLPQKELHGQTVGIIGLGPIGRGIALRAKAFGMTTLGWRLRPDAVSGVDTLLNGTAGLTFLLQNSDYVVLAAALTDATTTLLNADRLSLMKPTAWLINIARGAMLDEDALIDCLQQGQIAGACLDVFAREPLPDSSPLWTMPNVHISPHSSSGWTEGLRQRQQQIFVSNLARFTRSQTLEGIVDIKRGY